MTLVWYSAVLLSLSHPNLIYSVYVLTHLLWCACGYVLAALLNRGNGEGEQPVRNQGNEENEEFGDQDDDADAVDIIRGGAASESPPWERREEQGKQERGDIQDDADAENRIGM